MTDRYNRQLDLINQKELSLPIHILGVGGIGSWTALLLAKMGCSNIKIYDDDIVEDHNIASQFFQEDQKEILKTKATQSNIYKQTGVKVFATTVAMEAQINEGLIIIAIDSMDERRRLANLYKRKDIYIIDGRMGGLQMEIYCTPAIDYSKTLADEVSHDACTARAICFNCAVIAGLITNYVRLFVKKELSDGEIIFDFNNINLMKQNYVT